MTTVFFTILQNLNIFYNYSTLNCLYSRSTNGIYIRVEESCAIKHSHLYHVCSVCLASQVFPYYHIVIIVYFSVKLFNNIFVLLLKFVSRFEMKRSLRQLLQRLPIVMSSQLPSS